MYSLGIVPIRFQSIRLPNKTFKMVAGIPLIDWTIKAIQNSQLDDFIIVSSCRVVRGYCEENHIKVVIRPVGLESEDASIIDTISWLNDNPMNSAFGIQMLLQVTNPTRTFEDIDKCLDLMNIDGVNSICSVVDVGEYHPHRMFKPTVGNGLVSYTTNNQWLSTQKLPKLFLRDGSIYCWKTKAIIKEQYRTLLPERIMRHEIEVERSVRIDTLRDLEIAGNLLTTRGKLVS